MNAKWVLIIAVEMHCVPMPKDLIPVLAREDTMAMVSTVLT